MEVTTLNIDREILVQFAALAVLHCAYLVAYDTSISKVFKPYTVRWAKVFMVLFAIGDIGSTMYVVWNSSFNYIVTDYHSEILAAFTASVILTVFSIELRRLALANRSAAGVKMISEAVMLSSFAYPAFTIIQYSPRI